MSSADNCQYCDGVGATLPRPDEDVVKCDVCSGSGKASATLDARPRTVYTIHCSICGDAHEGEFGPSLWSESDLSNLSHFPLEDEDWELNLEGRALVCPGCHTVAWCQKCRDRIHAWEEKADLEANQWQHVKCRD